MTKDSIDFGISFVKGNYYNCGEDLADLLIIVIGKPRTTNAPVTVGS